MGARFVDYWENLKAMPEEGPFVACGGPVGVRSPLGIGCPVVVHPSTRDFAERHKYGRGHACASALNDAFKRGELVWRIEDGLDVIVPRCELAGVAPNDAATTADMLVQEQRFALCVVQDNDLLVRPWDYTKHGGRSWGVEVLLRDQITVTVRERTGAGLINDAGTFYGFVNLDATVALVCTICNDANPTMHTLVWAPSGRALTLEFRSGHRLWRVG